MMIPRKIKIIIKSIRPQSLPSTPIPPPPYVIKLPLDPGINAPIVIHVIANFFNGGSSRLVVDLIEGLGSQYNQQIFTSKLPASPAFLGVDPIEMSGIPSVNDVLERFSKISPKALHLHYWGECDYSWYEVFMMAAQILNIPVIENINTPVEPMRCPIVKKYVYVSNYVRNNFGSGEGEVIYPGSDLSIFKDSPEEAATRNSVGMVYRLEEDKLGLPGILPFIYLAKIRPKIHIYIVGGGSLLSEYRNIVRKEKLNKSFTFTDYVPYESLPSWYRRFGIFVAPVRKESFGQVSAFAMGMGIPVVGYDVGGIPEIINDQSLVSSAGEPQKLAKLISSFLDDKRKRISCGILQQERARSLFSIEAMINSYKSIYDQVIK